MTYPEYLHLSPGEPPPVVPAKPTRAILIAERSCSMEWQADIADWVTKTGCLYFVAWGVDCQDWHDAVDHQLLLQWLDRDIPDDSHIMTTWHDKEPLSEALWFAQSCAYHPSIELVRNQIVHISDQPDQTQILTAWKAAEPSD